MKDKINGLFHLGICHFSGNKLCKLFIKKNTSGAADNSNNFSVSIKSTVQCLNFSLLKYEMIEFRSKINFTQISNKNNN